MKKVKSIVMKVLALNNINAIILINKERITL